MTDSETQSGTQDASGVAGGVRVAPGTRKAAREAASTREQWKFQGRETLWGGYEFLVWTRQDGKRFARWVR
jgi:hypothetical protein